ncbi:MAG: hypothetical protein VR64_24020 [Desulfatitalea sp. BRH_c12]|nr:MAG: hypothetical protein VR64_24020 [Desulfatitalea sp. BRH_c12]
MALTADRDTIKRAGQLTSYPVEVGVRIFAGALVVIDPATGFARPARTAVGDMAVGRASEEADNTAGLAGAINVTVEHGTFRYGNLAADLVTLADVGADCFIVDDEDVARTNGGATRSRAGVVMDVDALGVWVKIQPST